MHVCINKNYNVDTKESFSVQKSLYFPPNYPLKIIYARPCNWYTPDIGSAVTRAVLHIYVYTRAILQLLGQTRYPSAISATIGRLYSREACSSQHNEGKNMNSLKPSFSTALWYRRIWGGPTMGSPIYERRECLQQKKAIPVQLCLGFPKARLNREETPLQTD